MSLRELRRPEIQPQLVVRLRVLSVDRDFKAVLREGRLREPRGQGQPSIHNHIASRFRHNDLVIARLVLRDDEISGGE